MSPFRPVDPGQSFPQLEEVVLQRWRERDVFHESIRRREGAERFVFYEGPPTANGRPGSHAPLFEYRGSMPVSGSHNIPTLGAAPSEAVRNLKAMVDGTAWGGMAGSGVGMRSVARSS